MKKYQTLKRLSRLKTYKKYINLSPKAIEIAKQIVTNNLIVEEDDIFLYPHEESISIDKIVGNIFPMVWIKITNGGNIHLGHWFEECQDMKRSFIGENSNSSKKIITVCNFFNSLCHKTNQDRDKIIKNLVGVFKEVKDEKKKQ